ncbi:hypothetical protein HJC23_007342 [Cyclotella cryptica]|uniref:Uncharacterized protein n=1 Tax=Cyclotella cryptica TaxID=29204 RepID=A0ABD3PDF2_9STRA|eukprot:CCRYP_015728-RA/>CCRYP_015728-RA protein AED:0.40 eAED:0.40 QI:0/-1/0/1/-1/1/1/0/167
MKFQLDLCDSDGDSPKPLPKSEGSRESSLNSLEDDRLNICKRNKADADSVEELMKGLELNLDNLLDYGEDDMRDDQGIKANPEMVQNRDAEASKLRGNLVTRFCSETPNSDCKPSYNTKVTQLIKANQQAKKPTGRQSIDSLPNHLKSLLAALSHIRPWGSLNNRSA